MPTKLLTATDAPPECPPSWVAWQGSMAIDHLEFLAVCSAWARLLPPGLGQDDVG